MRGAERCEETTLNTAICCYIDPESEGIASSEPTGQKNGALE